MKAQLISIGDELLIGQTIDTNSAWIGSELSLLGFDIQNKSTIHDNRSDILNQLSAATGNYDVVIMTGGLGPTSDDITKGTLCEFFETNLETNSTVLSMIQEIMHRRNFPMNENNRRQADVPGSARILTNAMGTAPGLWFEKQGTIFISLPGVPAEMKYIMANHVLPEFKIRFQKQTIIHRNIMTYGVPEARLAELLAGFEEGLPAGIKLAYLPSSGINKLRLTGIGTDKKSVSGLIEAKVKELYETIPELIYGENEESLEMVIGKLLTSRHKTVCTAESCTGGNIAWMLTSVPGSSNYFQGSIVAYSNRIKNEILGVDNNIFEREGAVSETVVLRMAESARRLLKTDYCVATSGIAGPDGGTQQKPVGTLCIAVSSDSGTVSETHTFGTERIHNIRRFSLAAMNLLRTQILRSC